MLRSQSRAFVSPDPVARRHPVGENEAQRIGEVCPEFNLDIRNLLVSIIKVKGRTDRRVKRNILWLDGREKHSEVSNVRQ